MGSWQGKYKQFCIFLVVSVWINGNQIINYIEIKNRLLDCVKTEVEDS